MNTKTSYITLVVIVILAIFGIVWLNSTPRPVVTDANPSVQDGVYTNAAYGYSFPIPAGQEVHAYTDAYVSVGRTTDAGADVSEQGFASKADIAIVRGDLLQGMKNMCAADGPGMSISCTGVAENSAFQSDTDISGVRYYLSEMTTNMRSGTSTVAQKGPFFAFNISPNVPDADAAYLVIHAPIATPRADVDLALIQSIVGGVKLYKVEAK